MNEIVWLSHGGPGSGRYPKGSGENPYQHVSWRKRRKIRKEQEEINKRIGKSKLDEYINSKEFLKNDYDTFERKKASRRLESTTDKRISKVDDKKENSKQKKEYEPPEFDKKENPKQKKEYESPEFDKKETVKREAPSSTEFVKAATAARNAASGADTVSKGVDKAWNSLHNAKYANEDRAKNVRGLTNEELRRTIDRIKLDQEYNKITMPPKSKGYDRTMAALAVAGSILTVTATGLSIAAGVQALRKK